MRKMDIRNRLSIVTAVTISAACQFYCSDIGAIAQGRDAQPASNNPCGQVSMCIFPVRRESDGQQYIITRAGYKITVPGLGIAPDANEIAVYQDQANNYWYVDRDGATQKVTYQQLQWAESQISQQQRMQAMSGENGMSPQTISPTQAAMNGSGTGGQPASNVIIQNNQPPAQAYSNGISSGGAAAVSGLAAMGGAMAGSAIADSMYSGNKGYCGIPYGSPCYNENGHAYYHGTNGERVPIAADTNNPYVNQWNRQTAYQDNQQNRHDEYNNLNPNQQQMMKNAGKEDYNNRQELNSTEAADRSNFAQERQERLESGRGGRRLR